MKLTRLALQNVQKSYRDYFVYFMTLMFSICLFYTFNSFQAQKELMVLNEAKSTMLQTVGIFMTMLSIFVASVLAFLILYANNFLIKRRKKEFGLYMLLGMEKKDISKVLICETLYIGLLSLVVGLLMGILCSQALGVFTAHLFAVEVNYTFVFSSSAALMTVVSFTVIFFVIMLLNTRVIAKVKLLDLLQAERKQEKPRIRKPWIAVFIFILSMILLGSAYYLATRSTMLFATFLVPILILGSVGTVCFFLSLSGFLLQFIRTSKSVYYRGLNMFVLRQVNAKVNTSFLSMSIVCLMLLLSIGALSVGWNLNDKLKENVDLQTPYHYTLATMDAMPQKEVESVLMLKDEKQIRYQNHIPVYTDQVTIEDIVKMYEDADHDDFYMKAKLEIISLHDYNEVMRSLRLPTVQLGKEEAFFISGSAKLLPTLNEIAQNGKQTLSLFHHDVRLRVIAQEPVNIATAYGFSTAAAVVVPDAIIPSDATIAHTFWNVDVKDEAQLDAYTQAVEAHAARLWKHEDARAYSGISKQVLIDEQIGVGVVFTYIGLYLGIVFLVASAAILALQQLSEAEDNRKRYTILRKIGAGSSMMHQSIYLQISIYFLLPLLLAILHAGVGIPVVSNALMAGFGIRDMGLANFFCAIIVIAIYGSYYLFTCHSYRKTLDM